MNSLVQWWVWNGGIAVMFSIQRETKLTNIIIELFNSSVDMNDYWEFVVCTN